MSDNKDIIICDCNSIEHQIVVYYDEIETVPFVYFYVHLNKRPFLQRLKYGLKYIFGRKSNYGAFDEFIFNPDDVDKLEKIVYFLKK